MMKKGKKTGGGPMRGSRAKGAGSGGRGRKTGGAALSHDEKHAAMMSRIKGDPEV